MPNQEVSELRNRILGVLIRNARDQARVSRRECADVLGISEDRFASYEDGQSAISLPELELLARYLEVPLSRFRGSDLNEEDPQTRLPNPDLFLPLRHRIVGARLRQLRQGLGRSQQDMADLLEYPLSRVADYEYGLTGIPVAELEIIGRALNVSLDYFTDRDSEVGTWHKLQSQFARFREMPDEMREFVLRPINYSYLELAVKLSQMPAGALRAIAEGLLEITY